MVHKSLKVNVILNVIKTIMSMIFPLITFPYASRILLPEGIGKVNFANSIISYFSIISALGINIYALRESAKLRDDKIALSQFVKEVFIINLLSTFVAYVLLFTSLFLVPKFFEYRKLIIVYSANMLFITLGIDWLYGAMEDYFYTTVRSIAFQVLSLILLFLFVHSKDDYVKYAAINVVSTTGAGILNFIHSRKYISLRGTRKLHLKKHISHIFILFSYTLAASVFTILDTSMLGFMSDSEQVGFYSGASKIIRMIRDLFPAIFSVLTARFSYYVSQNNQEKINDISKKTLNFIFCFSIPIVIGLIILMNPIVLLLCGKNYEAAIPVAQIMAPLVVFSACSGFLGGVVLFSQGKDKLYLLCTIIAAISDILLNILFIPSFGAFGAALATVITEGIIFVIYDCFLSSFIKQLCIIKNLLEYILSSFVMGIVVFIAQNLFHNIIVKLIVPTICGIIVYGSCLLIFKNDFILEILIFIKNKFITKFKTTEQK